MGPIDDCMLEAGDYIEAQLLANPVAHEDEESDDRARVIYR